MAAPPKKCRRVMARACSCVGCMIFELGLGEGFYSFILNESGDGVKCYLSHFDKKRAGRVSDGCLQGPSLTRPARGSVADASGSWVRR